MEKCETCGHEPRKIKNAFVLLQNIAAGLNKHLNSPVWNLEVILYEDRDVVLKTDVPTAIDYLANDIRWNEDGDWSNANLAEVRVM